MPRPIPVESYRDELEPLLLPGEEPILAEGIQRSLGVTRSVLIPDQVLQRLPVPVRDAAVYAMNAGEPQRVRSMLEQVVGGSSIPLVDADPSPDTDPVGGARSIADQLHGGLARPLACFLLVTDRRLVLARQSLRTPWHRLVAVHRAAVVGGRSRPQLFRRGRVVVDFADASQLSVLTAMTASAAGRRLADVLTPPRR